MDDSESLRASIGRIVVTDDDASVLNASTRALVRHGFQVQAFTAASPALEYLAKCDGDVDAVLSDLHMPGMGGLEFLAEVRDRWPDVSFVVMTGDTTVGSAIDAMKRGAYDYVCKPLSVGDALRLMMARAVEHRRLVQRTRMLERRLDMAARFEGIVGSSPAMRDVFQLVESVAGTDATVLVLGESGTGKELVARAIHARSRRAARPFLAVNCSALTETLLESELFGHVRGAFSGASSSRRGLFEEASGGTLFLDEIGDVSPAVQVRLLRALQEGEIKPVGASEIRKVDTRVVAATNRDLMADVKAGEFREDLYYRLNVVAIEIPALRHRMDDVPLLVSHFLERYASRFGKPTPRMDQTALSALLAYGWPGNVRELDNVIQRAVVLDQSGVVSLDALPKPLRELQRPPSGAAPSSGAALPEAPFTEARATAIATFERTYLENLLRAEGGNLAGSARRAGLDKSNLRRLVRRYGIELEQYRNAKG